MIYRIFCVILQIILMKFTEIKIIIKNVKLIHWINLYDYKSTFQNFTSTKKLPRQYTTPSQNSGESLHAVSTILVTGQFWHESGKCLKRLCHIWQIIAKCRSGGRRYARTLARSRMPLRQLQRFGRTSFCHNRHYFKCSLRYS